MANTNTNGVVINGSPSAAETFDALANNMSGNITGQPYTPPTNYTLQELYAQAAQKGMVANAAKGPTDPKSTVVNPGVQAQPSVTADELRTAAETAVVNNDLPDDKKNNPSSDGSGSKTWMYIVVAVLVAALIFFIYKASV